AEPERAIGRSGERHRMRRIEIGKFYIRTISSLDRADAERDIGAEMGVRDFLNGVTTRDHRLEGGGVEQHVPDLLGRRVNNRLALTAQTSRALLISVCRPARGRRRFGTAHELREFRRY